MPKHSSNAHFSNLTHRSARQRVLEELTLRARYLIIQYLNNMCGNLFGKLEEYVKFESVFSGSRHEPCPEIRSHVYKVLHERGYRMSEIAAVFGIHHSTVSRNIKQHDKLLKKKRYMRENYNFVKTANENYKSTLL